MTACLPSLTRTEWASLTAVGDAVIIPVGVEVNLRDAFAILPEFQTLEVLIVVVHVLHGPADLVSPAPPSRVVPGVWVDPSGQVSVGGGVKHLQVRTSFIIRIREDQTPTLSYLICPVSLPPQESWKAQ